MILCEKLRFSYPGDGFELRVDHFQIDTGSSVALVGASGCGKTTLLNLIAGICSPDSGRVQVDDTELSGLSEHLRQAFRLKTIGMVPQNFELLDYLTVSENLLVPFRISGGGRVPGGAVERVSELLERAGIADHHDKFPSRISQGERQRVAMCRGLIGSPSVILADEPTGNLDPENQEKIVALLLEEASRIGATVVMITHEPDLKKHFDRVIDVLELRRGAAE